MYISFTKENIFLITGAGSGIGRASAKLFNQLGASVIASSRDENKLQLLKKECDNPDNLFIEVKDLTSDIENLPVWVKSLKEKYGRLQGLICSAGVTETEPLASLDINNAKNLIDIDYLAPLMLSKGFADRRVNTGAGSTIVYISSFAAHRGGKGQTAYAGAKGALISSMRIISKELTKRQIRINSISPGFINTPMVDNMVLDGKAELPDSMYIGKPEQIADIVIFLSSHRSSWINGQDIAAIGYL